MKLKSLIGAVALLSCAFVSCDDDTSAIGSSLTKGEVTITVDSIVTDVAARSVDYSSFDGRNTTKLLGRLRVPEFGNLSCSFVSQMLSSTAMNIPDSITENDVDSMKLVLSVPRGSLTGDSLAPQQVKVFALNKQLPSGISSSFDPTGYYDPSIPLGTSTYTLSVIAKGDSAVKKDTYVSIPVKMPRELAVDIFRKYRANDPMFEWPSTFNQYFPGIYVEQSFGNGCLANITDADFFTYWHHIERVQEMQADSTYAYVDKVVRDSICLMSSQPEVLSSNIINYQISDKIRDMVAQGDAVVTTPGGYITDITFPVNDLLDAYHRHGSVMSMVSSLRMTIPAVEIKNDYGIGVAPYLLMVKASERDSFFAENKVPDGKTSFYAAYDASTGGYNFNSMRTYFLDILEAEQNGETIDADDMEFSLIPVYIATETVEGYSSTTIYVTKCMPYLTKPTMTRLRTDQAVICFTYTTQQID